MLVGLFAAPTLADEGEEPVEPAQFEELTQLLRASIEALEASPPLASSDLAERNMIHVAGADALIGSVRVAAAERVRWIMPWLPYSVQDLAVGGPALLMDEARRAGSLAGPWIMEMTAGWRRVVATANQLREAVAAEAPQRACPVPEGGAFENDWHDDRPWGRVHKGTDFHGEMGTPVVAIEAGTVLQANWHWAGGRQIYIQSESNGDIHFYAHLDAWEEWIWTGTRVEAGEMIGTLGLSGNADTPHLHFGMIPGGVGFDLDALVNPYPLLVEICLVDR